VSDGDVISIPTWIFRGFTSESDDAWLYTALGRDESGGLIWEPSVIRESAKYGMFLSADHRIIESQPGVAPEGVELVTPLTDEQLETLRRVPPEEMRTRLAKPEDLVWSSHPFLDSTLPGGGAQLASVIGYGVTEDRMQAPRLAEPHGFSVAWLRAERGQGVNRHRIQDSQVLLVRSGRWRVTLNDANPVSVELGPFDNLSVPPGAWRTFESVGDEPGRAILLTGGEGRTRIEWSAEVVEAALRDDVAVDANGYLAPASLIR
jgi:mannose-6-phosphate isomerase-like protein (cupin superfamily)